MNRREQDDSEYLRNLISAGRPIPPGTYSLPTTLHLDRHAVLHVELDVAPASDDTDQ